MTETDTRDALTLAFVAVGALVPVLLLAVIAFVGTFATPHGLTLLAFAIPAAMLGVTLVVGAELAGRSS